jgi:hypothetical protein
VDLPTDVVARFDGKAMAITGHEVDVVRVDNATGNVSSVPCGSTSCHTAQRRPRPDEIADMLSVLMTYTLRVCARCSSYSF